MQEASDHRIIYHHNAQNGTLLFMSNTSMHSLTFCKVTSPFSKDDLHITIPPDPRNQDQLR